MASPHYPETDPPFTPTYLYGAFANNLNWMIPMRTLFTLKDAPTWAALWPGPIYIYSLMQFPLYTFLVERTMDEAAMTCLYI